MPKPAPTRNFLEVLIFAGKYLWSVNAKVFLLIIFLNSINSLIIIPNLLLDKYFIDILVSGIGSPHPNLVFNSILLIVLARFGLSLLRTLSGRLSGYFGRFFNMRIFQHLEVKIGEKYASISVPTLEDPKFKDRYNRLNREGINRMQRISDNYVRVPQNLFGIFSSLSFFVLSQPIVVILSFLSQIPSLIVERIFIRKDNDLDKQVTVLHRKRGMYSWFLYNDHTSLDLRLLAIFKYLSAKINDFWNEIIEKRLELMRRRRTWGFLAGMIDNGVSYSFDALFGYQAITAKITIGTAQAYIRAISTFKQSVSDLTSNFLELYESYFYLADLQWFLNLETPYYLNKGLEMSTKSNFKIQFKNLWFKYPGTKTWILKGVNATINPKENVALVGHNGAGKTTLVKLLCGFYKPTRGHILLDGIDIEKLNRTKFWRKLSVLFQDSGAFGIYLREMISASNIEDQTNKEKIIKYAKAAQIDDWVQSLPLKYDTPASRNFDGGIEPSSGQWQRLIIARALFKDPEILVLDEPTSNIDPEAEEQIFNQIIDLGRDKIIFFISHRFSTVRRADKILVMDKGQIVEIGNHVELMGLNGLYSKLFTLQAKSYQ